MFFTNYFSIKNCCKNNTKTDRKALKRGLSQNLLKVRGK